MRHRLAWLAVAGIVAGPLGGCATVSPSPSSAAIAVARGSGETLRTARTMWIAAAVCRTGDSATGRADWRLASKTASETTSETAAGGTGKADGGPAFEVGESLREAARRVRRLELAPARDQADLVLYFEQADRLRCWACRQPGDLWHWWGVVSDASGRELASLHGETAGGADAAARQFMAGVRTLLRRAHRDSRGT